MTPPLWARLDEDLRDEEGGEESPSADGASADRPLASAGPRTGADGPERFAEAGGAEHPLASARPRRGADRPERLIGIAPAAGAHALGRLLSVLAEAYPVRFEPRAPGEWADLDGLLCFGDEALATATVAARQGVRTLALLYPEAPTPSAGHESFETADAKSLQRPLRGVAFPEAHLKDVPPLVTGARGEVLATRAGQPVWVRDGLLDNAAAAPQELGPEEALRERFQHDRCAALMPLVHFLAELTAGLGWTVPAPRATLLLDDPNLHWRSYGFASLPRLADHAEQRGYHVALAMIPLDAWFAHPATARLLRERRGALSLLVHGNNHTGGELGRPATEAEGVALAAQALRRIETFERRFRVPVARVMAPPHEACSEATVRGLALTGFDAISTTRPYPWLAPGDEPWLTKPAGASPLTGWGPADVTAGGLPLLLRHGYGPRKQHELALRAFLGQPLIVYGHHGDLADGLDAFAAAADEIDELGPTTWTSLDQMARASFQTLREGDLLRVRPLSRHVRVDVPPDVERVEIELPPAHDAPASELSVATLDGAHQPAASLVEPQQLNTFGGGTLDIRLRQRRAVDPHAVKAPRTHPLAVARRLAGETRDRALPLLARAGR